MEHNRHSHNPDSDPPSRPLLPICTPCTLRYRNCCCTLLYCTVVAAPQTPLKLIYTGTFKNARLEQMGRGRNSRAAEMVGKRMYLWCDSSRRGNDWGIGVILVFCRLVRTTICFCVSCLRGGTKGGKQRCLGKAQNRQESQKILGLQKNTNADLRRQPRSVRYAAGRVVTFPVPTTAWFPGQCDRGKTEKE